MNPLVRVQHLKSIMAGVGRLAPAARARIAAAIGPDTLREIEQSSGLAFMPLEVNVQLTRELRAVLGPHAADDFWRKLTLDTFHSPLFKALVQAAVKLFGVDPGSYAKWVARGWALVFRDCGTWTVTHREAGCVVLRVEDLPYTGERPWLEGIAMSLSTLFDLARTQGTVDIGQVETDGALSFTLSWEPF